VPLSEIPVDTSYLKNWDCEAENRKAEFMEYLYKQSGRTNGLLTNLWNNWCVEAGKKARDDYFALK